MDTAGAAFMQHVGFFERVVAGHRFNQDGVVALFDDADHLFTGLFNDLPPVDNPFARDADQVEVLAGVLAFESQCVNRTVLTSTHQHPEFLGFRLAGEVGRKVVLA